MKTIPMAMIAGMCAGAALAGVLALLGVMHAGQIPAITALGAGIACYALARKLDPVPQDSDSCCSSGAPTQTFLFLSGRVWALVFVVLTVILSAEGPRWSALFS